MEVHIPHYLATFALTAFLIHIFRAPARALGLLDCPGGRKTHECPVPLIGGIVIFCAFCFTVLFLDEPLRKYSSLFAGMGILLITGVLDDLRDISAKAKLATQVIAAILMASWGGQTVTTLGSLFGTGEILLGTWSVPFTVICTVGLINAINMVDGMDGLAGGLIIVALAWLVYGGVAGGTVEATPLVLMLIAATGGFLIFNFRHPWRLCATVFLGDAGSMMLGFALAWFAVDFSQGPQSPIAPIAIAWILAIPIFDAITLMARRMLKRQNPLAADREHLHHIFLRAGYSHNTTVNILIGINVLMGGIAVVGWQLGVPDYILLLGLVAAFVGHFFFVMHAWRIMKALKRLRRWRQQAAYRSVKL